ncbi:hypothetical protein GCM10009122_60480 [Fulvivirga kasyanovii]|uniref:DUF4369 domain-containing protein n=1 Tax=Fulvivirga kasyanovii TaxID=396812 RepID=A0ABW9RTG1_9BACT|nr:hypothetical protein [Fulvivirga kasyanovii]MTI26996.1 hypothetical protein [Fulvivirga kasyanovii]
MKLIALILIGFLNPKEPVEKWLEGAIVTYENEVITGEFTIDLNYNLLLLKAGKGVDVLPAHKINAFRFYDREYNINRKYIVLSSEKGRFPVRQFYEIVEDGAIQVLRLKKTIDSPYLFERDTYEENSTISLSEEAHNYSYYTFYNQELVPLQNFKKQVKPHLEIKVAGLDMHIAKHGLNPNEASSALRIIQYYNDYVRHQPGDGLATCN